jgi:hypothetical protein
MAEVQRNDQLLEEPACFLFAQTAPRRHKLEEAAPRRVLHHQHQVRIGEENLVQRYDAGVPQLELVHNLQADRAAGSCLVPRPAQDERQHAVPTSRSTYFVMDWGPRRTSFRARYCPVSRSRASTTRLYAPAPNSRTCVRQ